MIPKIFFYFLSLLRPAAPRTISRLLDRIDRIRLWRLEGASIGEECRILTKLRCSEPYLIELGNHVSIGVNVQFITHDGAVWVLRNLTGQKNLDLFGRIVVGNNVFIGDSAIILPDVSIGDNVIVAAGAVVTKNVAAGTIVAGVPARPISTVEQYQHRRFPECVHTRGLRGREREAAIRKLFRL
jgi:acetyltransferase-like isoleucine patch superfamily enzyme